MTQSEVLEAKHIFQEYLERVNRQARKDGEELTDAAKSATAVIEASRERTDVSLQTLIVAALDWHDLTRVTRYPYSRGGRRS